MNFLDAAIEELRVELREKNLSDLSPQQAEVVKEALARFAVDSNWDSAIRDEINDFVAVIAPHTD